MMTFKHLLRTNLSSDFKKTTQKEKDAKFFGASFFPPHQCVVVHFAT